MVGSLCVSAIWNDNESKIMTQNIDSVVSPLSPPHERQRSARRTR